MRKILVIALLSQLLICSSSTILGQINFSNAALSQGIDYSYGNGSLFGPGVTFTDFNNDGWDDLSICTSYGDSLLFFENVLGTFQEIDLNILDTFALKQINWVDIDNDGDKDLFTSAVDNGYHLYLNDGNLNFTEITASAGITTALLPAFSASWGDLNNDGWLDIYLSIREANGVISNILYRNNGDLTFTDITASSGLFDVLSFSFCGAWFDFNNDGYQDIYATADKADYPNRLYRNNGDETFTDVSVASGTFIYMDAMSATVVDYNYDGYLDFYVTNTQSGNVFLHNNGDGTFTDTAVGTGTAYNSIGWGAAFFDAENDGDQDLYVSGMLDGIVDPSSIFFEYDGLGQYTQPTNIGFVGDSVKSFGNALGDFNNDGYYDIAVANVDTSLHLWENGGSTNNWIKIHLEGTVSNRDGIGSWIKVYTNGTMQNRYTLCGESFCGQFSDNYIIGIGTETMIDSIEVNWLSGITDMLYSIPANQRLIIVEGMCTQVLIVSDTSVSICHGDPVTITTNNFDNYFWSDSSTADSLIVSVPGPISVEAWMEYCLHQTQLIEVYASSPTLDLGLDTIICIGDTLTLSVDPLWSSVIWQDNSTNDYIEITSSGIYHCTVWDSIGCAAIDSVVVDTVECNASIHEFDLIQAIQVSPNPSNGVFSIKVENLELNTPFVVTNSLGRIIRSGFISEESFEMDLSEEPNGSYFILIDTQRCKLIKAR